MTTQHNFEKSPLLRLPAELRVKIWASCLSNVHIRISARIGVHETDDLTLDWDSPGEPIGFDCTFYSSKAGNSGYVPAGSAGSSVDIIPHASYDLTSPHWNTANFPHRLSQLWRVCKLMYNETCDLLFTAGNTFHYPDLATFILHHKFAPQSMERIKSLSLSYYLESGFCELFCYHIEDSDDAEETRQVKSNLQRVLPDWRPSMLKVESQDGLATRIKFR